MLFSFYYSLKEIAKIALCSFDIRKCEFVYPDNTKNSPFQIFLGSSSEEIQVVNGSIENRPICKANKKKEMSETVNSVRSPNVNISWCSSKENHLKYNKDITYSTIFYKMYGGAQKQKQQTAGKNKNHQVYLGTTIYRE